MNAKNSISYLVRILIKWNFFKYVTIPSPLETLNGGRVSVEPGTERRREETWLSHIVVFFTSISVNIYWLHLSPDTQFGVNLLCVFVLPRYIGSKSRPVAAEFIPFSINKARTKLCFLKRVVQYTKVPILPAR